MHHTLSVHHPQPHRRACEYSRTNGGDRRLQRRCAEVQVELANQTCCEVRYGLSRFTGAFSNRDAPADTLAQAGVTS